MWLYRKEKNQILLERIKETGRPYWACHFACMSLNTDTALSQLPSFGHLQLILKQTNKETGSKDPAATFRDFIDLNA